MSTGLVERLEAAGRIHRARETGLRKRLASGDPTVSAQDPGNAARAAETQEQAANYIRSLEARLDRWEPKMSAPAGQSITGSQTPSRALQT
ncbi:MAG: hypothetical protein EON59_13450, partial [Alphaproteobacteria bacterium]